MLAYFKLFSRDQLGLYPLDKNGEIIYPENYDKFGWLDNMNYFVSIIFLIFASVMLYQVFENQKSGVSFIDKLKKENEEFKTERLSFVQVLKKVNPSQKLMKYILPIN